jgi:hypothetical protein
LTYLYVKCPCQEEGAPIREGLRNRKAHLRVPIYQHRLNSRFFIASKKNLVKKLYKSKNEEEEMQGDINAMLEGRGRKGGREYAPGMAVKHHDGQKSKPGEPISRLKDGGELYFCMTKNTDMGRGY